MQLLLDDSDMEFDSVDLSGATLPVRRTESPVVVVVDVEAKARNSRCAKPLGKNRMAQPSSQPAKRICYDTDVIRPVKGVASQENDDGVRSAAATARAASIAAQAKLRKALL